MITRSTPTNQALAYQRGFDKGKDDGAADRTDNGLWWQAQGEVNRDHRWLTAAGAEAAGYRDGWRTAKGLHLGFGVKLEQMTNEPPVQHPEGQRKAEGDQS